MSDQDAEQSRASAEQIFNQFCDSNNFREILQLFNSLCSELGIHSSQYEGFYSSLKSSLTSWKAKSLFDMLDARLSLPEYNGGRACAGRRALVVGAGPVGLRGAIELALLGAEVDLVEKRPDFQRNNSLHLWPFVITDLRNLGAKKFYGRFASGSIDHICIRILQAILLKICLLLGVKCHAGVTFKGIIEPKDTNTGWRVDATPTTTLISTRDYDVVLAADGKQQSLPGFRVKEFRAKLALAITVNYVNHNTQAENSVPEIGGVAFVYRQDFFNNLAKTHDIELENIVYYKDETHYFVMTVRKQSLLRKGVLRTDHNDPKQLLSKSNIDRGCLEQFALEATSFATEGALGNVEFERNNRGEKDVALFDFTSLFAAENAARIIERKGQRLLLCLAGDSLIEPFWPTGSGCARGFLGVFDNAWMIKKFCSGSATPLELVEEREAIFYLLPQTTTRRLCGNHSAYTIDPKTRYLNLSELVPPGDVRHLYDTDNQNSATVVSKGRSSVSPPHQEKPKPAVDQKTVESTIKRSKSSEVLSSEALSATPTSPVPHENQHQEPSISDVKNMWKNKSLKGHQKPVTKQDTKASSKDSIPYIKKLATGTDKSQQKKIAKTPPPTSKAPPSIIERTKTPPPFTDRTRTPPSTTGHTRTPPPTTVHSGTPPPTKGRDSPVSQLAKLTPVKQQQFSPTHKPSTKPPLSQASTRTKSIDQVMKKESKKSSSSPKLFRLLSGSKVRPRSESPEPSPKHKKKSFNKDSNSSKTHQLQTSRSLQNVNEEAEAKEARVNVHDIIKKYDLQSGSQSSKKPTITSDKGSKANGSSKTKKSDVKKHHEKSKKKDKESTKESKGGFFSFLKGRKSYDVAAASSKNEPSSLSELSQQPIVQRRINQLQQTGLMTDGAEDTDIVLIGVVPLEEDNNIEEMITSDDVIITENEAINSYSEASSEPVEEVNVDDRPGEERETPDSEGKSPVPEDFIDGLMEENSPDSEGKSPVPEDSIDGLMKENFPDSEGKSPVPDDFIDGLMEENSPDSEVGDIDCTERVKKLKEVFSRSPQQPFSRHLSLYRNRSKSKEIDLSDFLSQKSKPASSHPLWLARVVQGLNKCLEQLRRDNDIIVAKTALEILNTILSNVQKHPESDVYRRVRVSSESFFLKVWQLLPACQFMARAGWVEIDEFIVLPIDANVDNARRVLDKHLNIVNQMLWSNQLELPSTEVLLRPPRERAMTASKRVSYASKIVDESLQRIAEDPILTAQYDDNESSNKVSQSIQEETDDLGPATREGGEEEQTMKAASHARNIWKRRSIDEQAKRPKDKECALIPDSVLYGVSLEKYKQTRESVSDTTRTPPTYSLEGVDHQLVKLNQSGSKQWSIENLRDQKSLEKSTNNLASMIMKEERPASGQDEAATVSVNFGSTINESSPTDDPPQSPVSEQEHPLPISPNNSSQGDQLRLLLGTHSPVDNTKNKVEDRFQPSTDAQHSTDHSIRSERMEYDNLTMEVAAQTRQHWKEQEASLSAPTTVSGDQFSLTKKTNTN